MTRRRRWTTAAVLVATVAAGCGDDDDVQLTVPDETVPDETVPDVTVPDVTVPDVSTPVVSTPDVTVPTSELEERIDDARQALEQGDFSTLLDLLGLAGVGDELEGREVTLFAPTDEAFADVPRDDLSELLANPSQIDDVLRRHIVEGVYSYDELTQLSTVTTLSGETLMLESSGSSLTIEGATVAPPDDTAQGTEGEEIVVYSIDRVLLPGSQ